MKIIIPIEFYRKGGVERVIVSLIQEFIQSVDQVILLLPKKEVLYFAELLPPSERLVYETFSWADSPIELKKLAVLNKVLQFSKKLKLKRVERFLSNQVRKFNSQHRINYLIQKYGATHCLYLLINRLIPPKITVPLAMLAHDVFWRFAPLTYAEDYVKSYDDNLLSWLQAADIAFTNSEKTRTDILSIFPEFADKLKPIPLAGFASDQPTSVKSNEEYEPRSLFYFPSSFGIYKDHLTLLKAGLNLAKKHDKFKVILIGKETDGLVNGNLQLSQQAGTTEYIEYIQQCQQLHRDYADDLATYFDGLGYCSYEQVEYWYQHCSCMIMPSRYEGFGLAVSEAIARGVPAIVSDLEVFREQVELYRCPDRVAFFPPGDVAGLTQCMEEFMLQPKPRMTALEIQERFSHWTWHHVAEHYIQYLQQL